MQQFIRNILIIMRLRGCRLILPLKLFLRRPLDLCGHLAALSAEPGAKDSQEEILTAKDGEHEPKEGHGAAAVGQKPFPIAGSTQASVASRSPCGPHRHPGQVEAPKYSIGYVVTFPGM